MDRAVLVLSALLINSALGGPPRLYALLGASRLARFPESILRDYERKLNRPERSLDALRWRGTVLVVAVCAASVLAGVLLEAILSTEGRFLQLLLLALLLPVRSGWDKASQMAKALKSGQLARAKAVLSVDLWRFHGLLDEHGVARAAIETLAVHFSEKIVAPALWYLCFGLPGLFISKSLVLMKETLANSEKSREGFGNTAYRAHFIGHYIPARIAAFLWLAGLLFLPGLKASVAAKQLAAAQTATKAPEYLSLLAAALALNVSLGGPASAYVPQQWLGTGTAKAGPADIRRAQYLYVIMQLLLFVLLGLFA